MDFTIKGNSAIQKVLSNYVYAGLIKVPADKKRPDRYVKAIHLPIVLMRFFGLCRKCLVINDLQKHNQKRDSL
jgi:hypothetical protein